MSKYDGCPDCKNCKRKICDRYRDCKKFREWYHEVWDKVRLPFERDASNERSKWCIKRMS